MYPELTQFQNWLTCQYPHSSVRKHCTSHLALKQIDFRVFQKLGSLALLRGIPRRCTSVSIRELIVHNHLHIFNKSSTSDSGVTTATTSPRMVAMPEELIDFMI